MTTQKTQPISYESVNLFETLQKITMQLDAMTERLKQFEFESKEYFNIKEASDYLHISESTLYKMTSANKIPHYKPSGKIVLFKRDDLDSWILSSKVSNATKVNPKVEAYIKSSPMPTLRR